MNLSDFFKKIKIVTLSNPTINNFTIGSIYTNLNTTNITYPIVNVDVDNVQRKQNTNTYNIIIYYADRLLNNEKNKLEIQTNAITALQSIINKLINDENLIVTTPYTITPFSQKFTDNCGGGWCRLSVDCQTELGDCDLDGEITKLTLYINENGKYSVDLYDIIDVNVPPIPAKLQTKNVEITENSEIEIVPDSGFDGLEKVNIKTNVSTQKIPATTFNIVNLNVPDLQMVIDTIDTTNLTMLQLSNITTNTTYLDLRRNTPFTIDNRFAYQLNQIKGVETIDMQGCTFTISNRSILTFAPSTKYWLTNNTNVIVTDGQFFWRDARGLEWMDATNWDYTDSNTCSFSGCWDLYNLKTCIGDHTLEEVRNGSVATCVGFNRNNGDNYNYGGGVKIRYSSWLAIAKGVADLTGGATKNWYIPRQAFNACYNDDDTIPDATEIATRQTELTAEFTNKNWNIILI